jgi:hypothetical protein
MNITFKYLPDETSQKYNLISETESILNLHSINQTVVFYIMVFDLKK